VACSPRASAARSRDRSPSSCASARRAVRSWASGSPIALAAAA
jgi:hypothetical protein